MGIEPTWDFVEPHNGFEDRGMHQQCEHLHVTPVRRPDSLIKTLCPSVIRTSRGIYGPPPRSKPARRPDRGQIRSAKHAIRNKCKFAYG